MSAAAIRRVEFGAALSVKTVFDASPVSFVVVLFSLFFFPITFSIYVQERDHQPEVFDLASTAWYSIVTATTVGFGGMEVEDEVGRVLSMILCIAGVVIFSLLVVVVTRQLEFSDDEAVVWELVRRMQSLPELRRRAAATLDSTRQQVLRRAVGVVDEDDDGSASRSAISPELASASTDGSSSDSDSDGDDAAAEFGGVAGGSRLRSGSLGASFMAEPSEGIALVAARAAAGEETGRPGSMPPVGVAIQCEQAAAEAASHPVVASLPLDRAVMGAKPAGASAHGNTAKRAVDEDASNDASVRQMLSGLPTRLLLLFLAEQITEIQGIPARLARIEATLARLANQ